MKVDDILNLMQKMCESLDRPSEYRVFIDAYDKFDYDKEVLGFNDPAEYHAYKTGWRDAVKSLEILIANEKSC